MLMQSVRTLDDAELPLVIAPGAAESLSILGTEGSAELTVRSNDPDEPAVMVPLSAVADQAPTVRIDSPSTGSLIDVGETTSFTATVSDDVDPADGLELVWTSDVDGELTTSPAADDGSAVYDWQPEIHTEGTHLVSLTATDTCDNSVSTDITVCQQAGYTVEQIELESWHFEGSANWDLHNDWVELTTNANNQVGTAFATDETVDGSSVEIEFYFYIGDGSGADGISLTALDTTRMTDWVGGTA